MGEVAGIPGSVPRHQVNDVEQFKNPDTLAIITPAEYKSGNVIYPFEKARQ